MIDFKLWLEFEEVESSLSDQENDFANIHVDLADGRHYGLNIWTFKFFETAIKDDNSQYLIPPDLFVKELTRKSIEKIISDLLKKGDLEKVLNPSIYNGD